MKFICIFQIVSFLQQNAHPRVAEKVPTVPENVTDQVSLVSVFFLDIDMLLLCFWMLYTISFQLYLPSLL